MGLRLMDRQQSEVLRSELDKHGADPPMILHTRYETSSSFFFSFLPPQPSAHQMEMKRRRLGMLKRFTTLLMNY